MTTETTQPVEITTGITLTEAAASKVAALLAQEGRDDLYLRVVVALVFATNSILMIAIKKAISLANSVQ